MPREPTNTRFQPGRRGGWRLLALAATAVCVVALQGHATASAAATCPAKALDIVAHEDDSILFMNPDLQGEISAGDCIRTVFVTAGDSGLGSSYWTGREQGAMASYAQMAGVANTWTKSDAGIAGHPMPLYTLTADPSISLVFMRLPDGNIDGSGFSSTGFQSLQKLWQGTILSMNTIDGTSSYTKASLTQTLTALMTSFQPTRVGTQDSVGTFGDGDHSDHHASAYFATTAGAAYTTPHSLVSYADYTISSAPSNLSDADTAAKQATWFSYAPSDSDACQTVAACESNGYAAWWSREYPNATVQQPNGSTTNVAPFATVTASSQDTSTGQLAVKAVDGSADGYPGDYSHEWATVGQGVGATLTLTWSSPQTLGSITLNDRPNLDDQITGATITFSDGSSLPVGALPNDGSPLTLTFAAKTVTSLTLKVTSVSATTQNVGLAEIQAFTTTGGSTPPPSPTVSGLSPTSGPAGTSASVSAAGFLASHALTVKVGGTAATITAGGTSNASGGSTITFTVPSLPAGSQTVTVSDGTSSANSPTNFTVSSSPPPSPTVSGLSPTSGPAGTSASVSAAGFLASHALTVTVGGTAATITAGGTSNASGGSTITFTVPSLPAGSQTVTVSDGTSSANSPTNFTVTTATSTNVAPLATVTASSQDTSTGQLAVKAVDGSADGYPGDYSHEWATVGQGVGATLTLTWSSPQTLGSITLNDRPNLDDQITGATITFSDGSSLPVGALPNDGSPLTLTFAAKTVTSLTLKVTSVSATTQNVGLAEIQAFTTTGGSTPPPSPTVSGLSPTSGPAGTSASVSAAGFLASHALTVKVGGTAATITAGGTSNASGGSTITFTVPSLPAGSQTVTVSDGTSSANSPTNFTVSSSPPPSPTVSGLSPTSGPAGTSASVSAAGFLASHALTVTVGGTAATITAGGTSNASGGSTITFTVPSLPAGSQTVTVSDGTSSANSPTNFTVTTATSTNVAPLATVTASSQDTSTGQLAVKAVDGSADGYPGDYSHEWATVGQGVGATLTLTWSSPQTLGSITLNDRPNLDDQITGATITFSDGSSLPVGALPNDGSPLTLTFAAKTVTSLTLKVTSVSATTQNVGLAEIQAFTTTGG